VTGANQLVIQQITVCWLNSPVLFDEFLRHHAVYHLHAVDGLGDPKVDAKARRRIWLRRGEAGLPARTGGRKAGMPARNMSIWPRLAPLAVRHLAISDPSAHSTLRLPTVNRSAASCWVEFCKTRCAYRAFLLSVAVVLSSQVIRLPSNLTSVQSHSVGRCASGYKKQI